MRISIALIAAAMLAVVSLSGANVRESCQYEVVGLHDPVPALKDWAFRDGWRFLAADLSVTGQVDRGCRFDEHSFAVETSEGAIYGYWWGADIPNISHTGFLSSGQRQNVRVPLLIPSDSSPGSILVEMREDDPMVERGHVESVESFTETRFEFKPTKAADGIREYPELLSDNDDDRSDTTFDLPAGIVRLDTESDCTNRINVRLVPTSGGTTVNSVYGESGQFAGLGVHEVLYGRGSDTIATVGEYRLFVTCDGDWSVNVQRLGVKSAYSLPVRSHGQGNKILGPIYLPRGTKISRLTSAANAKAQLISVNYDTDSRVSWRLHLPRNQMYEIHKTGFFLVQIQSDGEWDLEIERIESQ